LWSRIDGVSENNSQLTEKNAPWQEQRTLQNTEFQFKTGHRSENTDDDNNVHLKLSHFSQKLCLSKELNDNCILRYKACREHRRSQGGLGVMVSPKFLAYLVILFFEKRYPKQNIVARLIS